MFFANIRFFQLCSKCSVNFWKYVWYCDEEDRVCRMIWNLCRIEIIESFFVGLKKSLYLCTAKSVEKCD